MQCLGHVDLCMKWMPESLHKRIFVFTHWVVCMFVVCLLSIVCLFVWMRDGWPKDKRAEITLSFFVSDLNSRKLQHKVNDKLWLVENYIRTQGPGRNSGPSHIGNFQYINSARFTSVTRAIVISRSCHHPIFAPWWSLSVWHLCTALQG